MKKYENFYRCLQVLKKSDRLIASENEIYRTGVMGQFNLTFELGWKALQAVLRLHSVAGAETGSPLELLKLGCQVGFLENDPVWFAMQKDRNHSTHVYDEEKILSIVDRILDVYIPTLEKLATILDEKIREAENF
ncbi:MAG: HI0074 family nucleotidyltransferase substrate-binding subunit [Planctomycetia bacterium]|nr:HI0074 family nucleotidyltransferase substrate-binding subunit [Planctomycetia bacterium]